MLRNSKISRNQLLTLALSATAFMGLSVMADTFTDDFEDGSNVGQWTYFAPEEFIAFKGGNPGRYLHALGLNDFIPQPMTAPFSSSIFTGDYREHVVTEISIDLILHDTDLGVDNRPLTLMLVDDRGTPEDFSDDFGVYKLGDNIPAEGEGWKTFTFEIPSDETSLPEGWVRQDFSHNGRHANWDEIIQNVDRVQFFYGDPNGNYFFQIWDVGLDNVKIRRDSGEFADIVDIEMVSGTKILGDIEELRDSDDSRVLTRSGFGETLIDLHNMEMVVKSRVINQQPLLLNVTVEARITEPAGTVILSLRNRFTGEFDTIGSYSINTTEEIHSFGEIDATIYVDGLNLIDLSIKHLVFVPFLAFTFDSEIDHVQILVN